MASTETKHRRGTATQCDGMTPVLAEIIVDTTNDRPRLGNGITAGGVPIPNANDLRNGYANTANASGTNTLTLTLDPVPSGYTNGMEINFKAANTTTGAATINVNSLGAKDLYKVSGTSIVAVGANDIIAGAYYNARYDGTRFVLVGAGGGVAAVTGSGGITVSPTTGSPNATIDTNNVNGVGAYAILRPAGNIANGGTFTGGQYVTFEVAGNAAAFGYPTVIPGGSAPGTWRNISGVSLASDHAGLCIRIA